MTQRKVSPSMIVKLLRGVKQSRIVSFLLRSWVLAPLLGSLAFFLLYFQPDRYLFSLSDSSSMTVNPEVQRDFYLDLNSDGKSEKMRLGNLSEDASCLLVWEAPGIIKDQWNYQGKFTPELFHFIASDFNHDEKIEISTITVDENRIYLNITDPLSSPSTLIKNRLVDTIWTRYGKQQPFLHDSKSVDLNHDGYNELIFSLSATYARQPRKVYAYDIQADSLWSSPYAGNNLVTLDPVDLDRDGKYEIIGQCGAPANYTDEKIVLQDSNSWFIVLDEQLNYKVPPRKMGPVFSQTTPIGIPVQDSLHWFVYVGGYQDGKVVSEWYRILPDYDLDRVDLPFNVTFKNPLSFFQPINSKGSLLITDNAKLLLINDAGKEVDGLEFPKRFNYVNLLNPSAGNHEFKYCYLVDGKSLRISFFSENGKKLGSIKGADYSNLISLSWIGEENGRYQLFLSGKKVNEWYEAHRNPWLYFQYLLWAGLIGVFYGFIELIKFSKSQEISRQERQRRELLELQLRTMKNQLDPHFTFNALNGLFYLAMSGDSARVTRFITHFSRLLRNHLYTSDQTLVKLSNEIGFLVDYMELQRMRFDDLIILDMDIDPDVDTNQLVPKMILQTHVENAVKHGLMPKFSNPRETAGKVKVSVFPDRESTVILIEDNGVGRGSENLTTEDGTGKGLLVLNQIFSAVRQLYKLRITQVFEDLKDKDGNAVGTRVRIVIN